MERPFAHFTPFMASHCAHRWRNGAASAFAYILLHGSSALAGHAPLVPEPRTILLREGDANHVVVGTRRGGYFATRDAGSTWSWICEAGVGYEDEEVYPGVLLASGKLVLSTGFGGLATSADGCGFQPWQPSEQPFIADVHVHPSEPGTVLALEARPAAEGFVNQLWRSTDEAETWQPWGDNFAPDARATSFAVSTTGAVFVAASAVASLDLLSADVTATSWSRTTVALDVGTSGRIIGAHATSDSTQLYVLVDYAQLDGVATPGDRVLVSVDSGASFTTLLDARGDLSASSMSGDGTRLAVGGHSDGVHVMENGNSALGTATLTQVSTDAAHALAWSADGRLYRAGHEASDGFSVGVSGDGGRTFTKFFALCQVKAPLACQAGTSVGSLCLSSGETGWDVRREVADESACRDDAASGTPPRAAVGSSSGEGGATDAGSDAAPSAANSSSGAAGCSMAPRSAAWQWLPALLAGLVLRAALARRRVRQPSQPMRAESMASSSIQTVKPPSPAW